MLRNVIILQYQILINKRLRGYMFIDFQRNPRFGFAVRILLSRQMITAELFEFCCFFYTIIKLWHYPSFVRKS